MKFMKLGSRPDTFYSSNGVRSVSSEVRTDLIIQVNETRYLLHKFPLLSKCLKLQRLCSENTESSSQPQVIELVDFPGGVKAFELCAKFCYGITVTLSAYNIVLARCAAKYLQMTEDVEKGNLVHKLEVFLNSCILNGWKDCIVTLQTTKPFHLWSEELGITSRCIESLVSKVVSNPLKVIPHSHSHQKGDIKEVNTAERWWGDYLSELRIDLYWRIMAALKSGGKVPPNLIGASLKIYTSKWLPRISRKLENGSGLNSGSDHSSSNCRLLLESIISLLPIESNAVSCSFLLKLLKAVNVFQASGSSKLELARRVALQLDEAKVCDLMIPSVSNGSDTIYDVDIFLNILEQFMLQSQSQQTSSSSALNGSMIKVSKLVDGYLQEIARDVNVPLSKFIALIEAVPELARLKHDDLYKAIDIYLKTHPDLNKRERKDLCRTLDCKKLSLEVCMHAAQNELLPLRVVVQVLFSEQTRAAMAGGQLTGLPSNIKALLAAKGTTPSTPGSLATTTHTPRPQDKWLNSPNPSVSRSRMKLDADDESGDGSLKVKQDCLNPSRHKKTMLSKPSQSMASQKRAFLLLVVVTLSLIHTIIGLQPNQPNEFPFTCFKDSKPCNSILYQHNDLTEDDISSLYSVDKSQIKTIGQGDKRHHLVTVRCSCQNVNNTIAYFYDTIYPVKQHDTFLNVSDQFYSGQAWAIGDEGTNFRANTNVTMHLLCGCAETDAQVMVTYTVEPLDTLSDIADRLSADVTEIESVNSALVQKSGYIQVGWVLFVPMYKNGVPSPKVKKGKNHKWTIIFGILLSVVAVLLCVSIILMFMKRKRSKEHDKEASKAESKTMSLTIPASAHTRYLSKESMEGITGFDTERPLIYDFNEIAEATNNFDDTRKIGEGGYGSVYFGILGEKEVAIKKMRSNKSKEFLAEVKVLCKIHHINVVELLGFASGDDHLYLVYEFISNGSLSEHLHDPLLKAQIALDAAKGIEYIHDHTKERYVHRDIKTSNILLDDRLRAKVADFGLAKLVGRTNDDDFVATRLVGTPGYLPPESVKELHVTTKTDVFAFGVVLAELITGKRALMRDNREPNKMKSLITTITKVFEEEEDPEGALVLIRDGSLRDSYPIDDLYKMAEIAYWCLSEDPNNRPEIREVVESVARIVMSSIEWEASLGGSSQVFSGVFDGR
ncbi:hypothetical protein M8C21_017857 [Ambrosia artemisiifolia]|uniref:Uncharacterized protein n=1 Tax=Ambrosia artemisiifolia TaxID=4212 RepID=A0AAD5C7G1_AMBAR|nr:hypothetical protein M8C21_017857 [Ambrosia artemisiifolia]